MRFALPALLAALSLSSTSWAASSFEGVIEMKMTAERGSANIVLSIGKEGSRSEMHLQAPQPITMTMLVKTSEPDNGYAINDANKTYTILDLKKARDMAKSQSAATYTAKKLGEEKASGYLCAHALLTSDKGESVELWTNKDIIDVAAFAKAMGPNGPTNDNIMKALKDAKADGFIVKMVRTEPGAKTPMMTMELVRAEKKALPSSTFQVPAGYTKAERPAMGGMGGAGAALPKEVQDQIRDKLNKLTPEQRKQLEEAMKAQGAAAPH